MNNVYSEWEDARLVKAARHEPQAFDALYRRYVDRIFRYCYVRTSDRPDAEDLTAQVFLAALESFDRYRERGSFAAWLFAIARNTCAQHHRARYAHPEVALDKSCPVAAVLGTPVASGGPGTGNPECIAIRRGIIDCIRRMFGQLSEDQREALHLRFWGGLTAPETARVMGCKAGAIKMSVWRSLDQLRKRCVNDD